MGNILPLQVEYRTLVSIKISPITLPIKVLSFTHLEHSMGWHYSCCFNHHTWFRIHEKRDSLLNLPFPCPFFFFLPTALLFLPFWSHFLSVWRISLFHSLRLSLLGTDSLSFRSSGNVFFSSSYLKDILWRIEFRADSFFFFFQHLKNVLSVQYNINQYV